MISVLNVASNTIYWETTWTMVEINTTLAPMNFGVLNIRGLDMKGASYWSLFSELYQEKFCNKSSTLWFLFHIPTQTLNSSDSEIKFSGCTALRCTSTQNQLLI
jgi:hypothetical protein